MKLWLLKRRHDIGYYDEAQGFVVRADSASAARTLASERAGDEGAGTWLSPKYSSCAALRPDGTKTIILREFNAG